MKYLKLFESFNKEDIQSIVENLEDLFIYFDDEGWKTHSSYNPIVPDRNDWTGNFRSTKVRNIYGVDFIDYNKDVIMSKDGRIWNAQNAFIVTINKLNYIKPDDKFESHWKNLDKDILGKLPVIQERAKRLGVELFGVHGKWFTLGQNNLGDKMLFDCISFAFTPIL